MRPAPCILCLVLAAAVAGPAVASPTCIPRRELLAEGVERGDRFQTLVLASRPERLGEWRRGLQDCLGLSRDDFGPGSGIVLFERPDALIERADRLEERGELPFIVIDAAETQIDTPILQFPLWLAFAAGAEEISAEDDLY